MEEKIMAQALRLPNFGMTGSLRRDEGHNRRQWSSVRSLQSPAWLREIYDGIAALSKLQGNWDSYGGLPVADGAISMARVVLSNLNIEDMPKPHVAAIPDGGLGLHWRVAERDLEIEVEPNGAIHYLKTHVGGDSMGGDIDSWEKAQEALDWVLGR
jgi:hypothetical protein